MGNDDRVRKAQKISSILLDFYDGNTDEYICLDLGCSSGIISTRLTSIFKYVVGIDVDLRKLRNAQLGEWREYSSLQFIEGSGYALPFIDCGIDVVVCAQVYEHVQDAARLVNEIKRILRPGGICFFSGPNRLAIMEEHYWLPFLSWLPHKLATVYMKIMRRGKTYDIYPQTYWQLTRMWGDFTIVDYSLKLLRRPRDFSIEERVGRFSNIAYLPNWLLRLLTPYFPNYNWVVVKPK